MSGCGQKEPTKRDLSHDGTDSQETSTPINAKRKDAAEQAAIAEVARREGVDVATLQADAILKDGDWEVLVTVEPALPGGFYHLVVSDDGKVKKFVPGE